MKFLKFYYFFFITTIFFTQIQKNIIYSKIIFVFEHVRHGTRTPPFSEDSTYTDQFGTKWEGNGELTAIGKRIHYILGVQNRIKYSSLLDFSKFNPKEIQIFSTNSVRTLKSLEAELHAMYLPGTGDTLSEEELLISYPPDKENLSPEVIQEIEKMDNSTIINKINVFPIQFFPDGKVFSNEPDHCPYMTKYRLELEKRVNTTLTEFMKEFDKKYGDKLRDYLKRPNKDFIYTYGSLIDITDNYICNYDNAKNLSGFLTFTGFDKDDFYKTAIEVKKFYLFHLSSDQKAGLIGATPIMTDVINYMENKVKNENNITYSEPKMVIQGGHDTTLNVIQFFMEKAFDIPLKYVKFGANIYFELHQDDNDNNKYFIKYFYDGKLLLEKDYNEFKQKVLETILSEKEINDFCFQDEKKENDINNFPTILILTITNIILVLTTALFAFLFCHSKNKNASASELSSEKLTIVD